MPYGFTCFATNSTLSKTSSSVRFLWSAQWPVQYPGQANLVRGGWRFGHIGGKIRAHAGHASRLRWRTLDFSEDCSPAWRHLVIWQILLQCLKQQVVIDSRAPS